MQHPGPHHYGAEWHGPWMSRAPSRRSRRARLLVPVIISLIVQVPAVFFTARNRSVAPLHLDTNQFWVALVLAIVGPLALLAARRFPGLTVAVVTAAACLDLFIGAPDGGPIYISLAFAIVGAVVRGARLWAWISVAAGWVISITVSLFAGVSWSPVRIALTTFGILIVFGVAEAVRTRRERYSQIARFRAERQQSEVQAERVRIARELHDVLAHSLSQINVQAGVGLHLMDSQPDKARDALASIKETSKSALDEVRSVLGVLRSEGAQDAPLVPEPDLSRLESLAASVRTQGLEVSLTGELADVPQATQLAIYRIVQESLTNVLRHANATRATIELHESDGFYRVTVTDNGTAPPPTEDAEGRGLLGMRERAELLGGTLAAEPVTHGGFRIAASIPVRTRVGAE